MQMLEININSTWSCTILARLANIIFILFHSRLQNSTKHHKISTTLKTCIYILFVLLGRITCALTPSGDEKAS